MGQREWADAEYSRIYWTIVDDQKFAEVYEDDRRWAAYVRLLMAAEATYPSAAPIPRWLADDVLAYLCEVRIVEVVRGQSYRIVGLQTEREGRISGRAVGGTVRANQAERDEFGHFLPAGAASSNGSSKSSPGASTSSQHRQQRPATGPAKDPANPAGTLLADPANPAKDEDEDEDENRDETRISLPEVTTRAGDRPDVQALRDRGWKRVTAKQRAVLDEVLARHDVTGPSFAAEVIKATPKDRDPLTAVMDADRRWQAAERARAEAEEVAAGKAKAKDRAEVDELFRGPSWMTTK